MSKQLKPLNSTLLQAYSYSAEDKKLSVIFHNGKSLTYSDVNPDIMSKVFDAPGSIGSKFNRLIARKHKFQETPEEAV